MTVPITLVNDRSPRTQSTASGSNATFACDWPLRSLEHLRVEFNDGEIPEISYTITGLNNDAGFSLTFDEPPPADTRVTIYRVMPVERQVDYGQQRLFSAAAVNADLADHLMMIQELRARILRTMRLAESDPVINLILPVVSERANKYAFFNSLGELTAVESSELIALDFAQYPAGTPLATDIFAFNRIDEDDETELVQRATLAQLATLVGSLQPRPFLTAEDIGLAGDGVTDDGPALQRAYDAAAAAGGASFFLKADAGQSFFFKGAPRGGNNCSTVFASPHTVGRYGRLTLQGRLATDPAVTGMRLLSDTAAADTALLLDTSTVGGGVVSDRVAVGDTLYITGLRDSCGTPIQDQEVRVTALDDGLSQVTVSPALDYAYEVAYTPGDYETAQGTPNVTLVSRVVSALLASDMAAGDNLVSISVGDVGQLTEGDLVMVVSEAIVSDVAGTSTLPTHIEFARVIPSLSFDPVTSLRLSRRVERTYTTAKFARLLKVQPIINASIQGATVEFTEAPGATDYVHCYEIVYGADCTLDGCTVPNTDIFGTRGNSHRITRSIACGIIDPVASNAHYFAASEGYGAVLAWCTDCWARGGSFTRMRHSVLFQGATNSVATNLTISDPRHTAIDFHGVNEVGCRVVNPTAEATTSHETLPTSPNGICFGNTTHLAGAHRCGVEGGRFINFKGEPGTHKPLIQQLGASTGCYVRDTEFHNIGMLFFHEDLLDYGTLVSSGFRITGVNVDGCLENLFYINGRANGASVDTLVDMEVAECTFRNINIVVRAANADELQFIGNRFDEITPDVSFSYLVEATSCPNLVIEDNKAKGASRFLKITDCLNGRAVDNTSADQVNVTMLREAGANTGFIFARNHAVGFIANTTRLGTAAIQEYPTLSGTALLLDDGFLAFKPRQAHGRCVVRSIGASTVFAEFRFWAGGTPITTLVAGTATANIEAVTGALAGTTGTDAKFTVSAHSDGLIYFENRLGSSVTIDASVD